MCAGKDDDGKKQQYGREETTKHTADTREEKTEKTTSPVFFELQLPGPGIYDYGIFTPFGNIPASRIKLIFSSGLATNLAKTCCFSSEE